MMSLLFLFYESSMHRCCIYIHSEDVCVCDRYAVKIFTSARDYWRAMCACV